MTASGRASRGGEPDAVAYIGDFDSGGDRDVAAGDRRRPASSRSARGAPTSASPTRTLPTTRATRRASTRNGHDTFARLVPSDAVQAQATVSLHAGARRLAAVRARRRLRPVRCRIAQLVANDAPEGRHHRRRLRPAIDTETNTAAGRATPRSPRRSPRRAPTPCCSAGGRAPARIALWRSCTRCSPHAKLFAPSTLATPGVPRRSRLGARSAAADWRARRLRDQPDPAARQYPRHRAARVSPPTVGRFGSPPTAYALYGYAAMRTCCRRSSVPARAQPRARVLLGHLLPHLGRIARRARRLHDQRPRRQLARALRRLPRERGRRSSCLTAADRGRS